MPEVWAVRIRRLKIGRLVAWRPREYPNWNWKSVAYVFRQTHPRDCKCDACGAYITAERNELNFLRRSRVCLKK